MIYLIYLIDNFLEVNRESYSIMMKLLLVFFQDIWAKLNWRIFILFFALLLNSFVEGLGLSLLFPFLQTLGIGQGQDSPLSQWMNDGLQYLGITLNLSLLLVLLSATFVIQNCVFVLQSYLSSIYQCQYAALWRNKLFKNIIQAKWKFFLDQRVGTLINGIINETNRLSSAFFLLIQIVVNLVLIGIYFLLAILSSWQTAVILACFGAALFVLIYPFVLRGRKIGMALTHVSENMQSFTGEILNGAKLVKASAIERPIIEHFIELMNGSYKLNVWGSFNPQLLRAVFESCGVIVFCVVMGFGITKLELSPASILVAVYLYIRLYSRLATLPQTLQLLNINLPSLETLQKINTQAIAEQENYFEPAIYKAHGINTQNKTGVNVTVNNLTVWYTEQKPVLSDVSLDFSAGEILGIVGGSGSGKTTLIDCMLGLIVPNQGTIKIDGTSLGNLSQTEWRQKIGYVSQETVLFNTTIRENIVCWRSEISEAEMMEAARKANAHDFISSLPKGYETVVGERGICLSGGQRQRLGLARALIGEKKLLILDEATSALDSLSENLVIESLEELKGSITTIMVAHRLSTLKNADRIYLFEKGRILESGTWAELLKKGQLFTEFWNIQSQVHTPN